MKNTLKLILCILGCELVGIAGTPFTVSAIPAWYSTLNKPFFAPPNWLFGPVWTTLYLLMGISVFLILKLDLKKKKVKNAIFLFLSQLGLNFLWTPIFFGLRSPVLGLFIIVSMLLMIFLTIRSFFPLSKIAAYLLIPYLLWVGFASLLNMAIVILN